MASSRLQSLLAEPEPRLGPFVLVRQLGKGGFAPVWLAREVYGETELRTVAIKLFPLGAAATRPVEPEGVDRRRVLAEARALCRVEHPNVVRFLALMIDEERGVAGLVMEHLAGRSLGQWLASAGKLDVGEAVRVGEEVASALSAVHEAGLLHRDIKPDNVVEAAGVTRLIDFGISAAEGKAAQAPAPRRIVVDDLPFELGASKASALAGAAQTAAGPLSVLSGTMGYIAPERVAAPGRPATAASDLYALGATLFECLTGSVPAAAAQQAGGSGLSGEVLDGRRRPPPLRSLRPEAPEELGRLVDALLDPDERARPASAEQVMLELAQLRAEAAGQQRALPPEEAGPFRGLDRFEQGDRGVYFGRGAEVAGALEALRAVGLVTLVGTSGAGKSSLARAGVVPAVSEGALGGWPAAWDAVALAPGPRPRRALLEALLLPELSDETPPAQAAAALGQRAQRTRRGLLVLVDQLEELVTLAQGEEQGWTAEFLGALGQRPLPGVRVLATARQDLLDGLLGLRPLGRALVRGVQMVAPLGGEVWPSVVDRALGAYGYAFEDEALRREVLDGLRDTSMPLGQFALEQLWKKRDPRRRRIDWAALHMIGGVGGALERHAERVLAQAAPEPAQREAARLSLLAMTTPQGTRAWPTRAELDAIGPGALRLVEALEQARLVLRQGDRVSLAHEELLRQWSRLRGWLVDAREDRLLLEDLERAAERWMVDRDEAQLFRGRRLDAARALRRGGRLPLSRVAGHFLDASGRAAWQGRALAALALLALVCAVGAAAYQQVLRLRSERDALQRALDEIRAQPPAP